MDIDILKINNITELHKLDGATKIARYFAYDKLKDFLENGLYFSNCELFDEN